MAINERSKYLNWMGEFSDAEDEAKYRITSWPERFHQLRLSFSIGGIIFTLFGLLDLIMIDRNLIALSLMLIRILLLLWIVFLIIPDRENNYQANYDYTINGILVCASLVLLSTVAFYDQGVLFHLVSVLLMIVGFYLFIPTSLLGSLIPTLALSIGFLLVSFISLHPEFSHANMPQNAQSDYFSSFVSDNRYYEVNGVTTFWVEYLISVALIIAANVLSPITAIRLNKLRRQEYSSQLVMLKQIKVQEETEIKLKIAHDKLENKVFERTAELVTVKERLNWQSNFDPLTGLPNRWVAQDRLSRSIKRQAQNGQFGILLFLGLDGFNKVNDSLGHTIGDNILIETSKRIQRNIDERATLARFSGDEFLVILDQPEVIELLDSILSKISDEFSGPFILNDHEIFLSMSIGIVRYPEDGVDVDTLLGKADSALHQAKGTGGNAFCFYEVEMNKHIIEKIRLESGLRHALEQNEFQLHFQPIVCAKSGTISGAEALLRWNNESLGNVRPDIFIPIAEQTGLIESIGEWVLEAACQQAVTWPDLANGSRLIIAINVSSKQLIMGGFPSILKRVIEDTGISPGDVEIELTESYLAKDPDFCLKQLQEIKAIGVKLSIDDFGTGYSALNTLRIFPFSTLKIDQSFMPNSQGDSEEARLVSTIITMAKNLNLDIIAEGVETVEQWQFLRENGCDLVQGFYMSRPVPANEFVKLIDQGFVPPE